MTQFGIFCFYIILKPSSNIRHRNIVFGIFCFYIILKRGTGSSGGSGSLVSSAFTSFSNLEERGGCKKFVWYLLLLHHSQTAISTHPLLISLVSSAFTSFSNLPDSHALPCPVWYLLLLHHSQTLSHCFHRADGFGIFCFYIILKLWIECSGAICSLVSSAFTSFSNSKNFVVSIASVWYLLLLHHSQTPSKLNKHLLRFDIFCFYIILKRLTAFTCGTSRLVPSAFTSFSNKSKIHGRTGSVWYLLLLHHSQTLDLLLPVVPEFGTFCFYIILKRFGI